jgi:RNA polymerase sigma-54 factor
LKQALQIRHNQRLQLTPQLQQSIRLLQMSYADLTQEISVAMESNPFLEEAESTGPDAPLPDLPVVDTDEESALEDEIHADRDDPNEHYWDSTATSAHRWDEPSQASSSFDPSSSVSVSAESQWQNPPDGMTQVLLGESDQWIAHALIGCLDPQGYLAVDYDELRQILAPQTVPEDSEINSVLHLLQQLSWPGIGARDLRECLTLQLSALDPNTPELNTAQRLVETHLALLSAHRYDELVRLLDIDRPTLARALALIHSLDPKPGERLFEQVATSILPDAMVRRQGDRWTTSLTQENAQRVQLNDQYLSGQDPPTQKYLQENLRNAQWFIRSLEQRDSTILRVAREIVDVQQGFMDHGDSALVPLTMRVVAQRLELHESTISRAVDQKHLLTPHGVYPLKYFFSGGVGESSGPATSARAVQARIRKVIESEAPLKPVSDSQLVTILDNEGIQIARRTVAKYREQMNIPPATQRRSVL